MTSQTLDNPFILIDGSSYLYRAYYALPYLTNSVGNPTGAMYGVIHMLRNLITKYHPTHATIVFDSKGKTFRSEIFKEYKSNRSSMPRDLQVQIVPLCDMIRAMGVPLIMISGVEADDVIGTIACSVEKMNRPVLISTNDKDMAQLVTPNITLISTMKNCLFGPEEVVDKYGVPPELIVDLLALTGDSSDNIPGVPGIGKKIAQILLKNFGDLNSLYTEPEKVSNLTLRGAKTIAIKLKKNKKTAYFSYQLAKIRTDIKIDIDYEQLKVQSPNIKDLLFLFKEYEFKRWVVDIESGKWFIKKKQIVK